MTWTFDEVSKPIKYKMQLRDGRNVASYFSLKKVNLGSPRTIKA